MAQEQLFRDVQIAASDIHVRKIGVQDLFRALRSGYEDFNAKPTYIFFLFVTYPLFALVLTLLMVGENLMYLAFPVVAGFTLLGPVVSVALFEMSRRRERGLDIKWRSAFEFIHTSAFAPIVGLSIVMMLLYVAWLFLAEFIYVGLFGSETFASFTAFFNELISTRRGGALVMYGFGVGFLFAFAVLALSVIAFPLLLDRPASVVTAMNVSVRAVTTNLIPMALWGLIVVALLGLGAALFLVGLAAVLPILGHATWHLYRKVVAP